MSNTIEVTREQLEAWKIALFTAIRSVDDCSLYDEPKALCCANQMQALLAAFAQPISPLQAEVMALQPAPFSSLPLGKTIVDANNKAIGYARGITILQQDEMHNMVCEALNEYWAKHKV